MVLDLDLFLDLLNIDSTSSHERELADFLESRLYTEGCTVSKMPQSDNPGAPANLLFAWGDPQIVFCTHLDTVPPYIAPTVEVTDSDTVVRGRGTCDAKGQIFAMYSACQRLASDGKTGFGLLLLHGEETGSYGAKEYRNMPGGLIVIVGEPTDNRMVQASKGTKLFEVTISGKAFHSGYPQYGKSAVETFVDFVNNLRAVNFPDDPVLGATTYNIGKLVSDNPQNILSSHLTCRVYFRTTFASDTKVSDVMKSLSTEGISIKCLGGDTPMHYTTLPGFETTVVSFGSDAPQLTNFTQKALCGPGTILVAHTDKEYIKLSDIEKAVENYVKMFDSLNKTK